MLRSLTLFMAIVWAGANIAAQSQQPSTPGGASQAPGGAGQQTPTTPRPDPGPSSTPSAQRSSDTAKVTYVGCVRPGTGADSFVLESASIAPAAGSPASSSSAPSAVGTSGAGKGMSLNLSARSGTDLKSHLNQRVEVTGTMAAGAGASASSGAGGATSSSGAAGASSSAGSASGAAGGASSSATAKPMNFNVETVKMVSASCS